MENKNNFEYYFNQEKLHLQSNWRRYHVLVLSSCSLIVLLLEIVMAGILITSNNLFSSLSGYIRLYVLIPTICYVSLNVCTLSLLAIKKIPSFIKNYIISISFDILCLMVCYLHDIFIAVFASGILSIFLTVIYCDKKLTIATTIVLLIGETFIGIFGKWDYETVKDFYYICSIGFFDVFLFLACSISFLILDWEEKRLKVVSDYQLKNVELKQEVQIDPLTRLNNRRALRKYIDENANHLTYVMSDINKFKTINDTWGHLIGDNILTDLSSILRKHINTNIQIFRYGGDEFLFACKNLTIDQIIESCTTIKKEFNNSLTKEMLDCGCGISFGIAEAKATETPKESLHRADEALYRSKTSKQIEISR